MFILFKTWNRCGKGDLYVRERDLGRESSQKCGSGGFGDNFLENFFMWSLLMIQNRDDLLVLCSYEVTD